MMRSVAWTLLCVLLLSCGCSKKNEDQAALPKPPEAVKPAVPTPVTKPAKTADADEMAKQKLKLLDAFKAMGERQEHPRRRRFQAGETTTEQRAKIERIKAELANKSLSAEKKIGLLGEAADITSPDLVNVVLTALDDDNEDVRVSAMELLNDLDEPSMLPAVQKGMQDKSDQVRDAALASLYYVSDPRVSGVLASGIKDDSALVRETAMQMIAEQPVDVKYQLYDESIQSSNKDVFMETIANLEDESNHQTILILFKGLKHSNTDFRNETNDALDFLISHTFTSYDEAVAWWAKNKNNYDDELFEKQF